MKTGIKVWEGKTIGYKKCSKCDREWTPKSLNEKKICPDCQKNIMIEYSPLIKEMKENYEKTQDISLFTKVISQLNTEGYFEKEELYLKCSYCDRFVDELLHCEFGVLCKDCYYMKLWEKNREKQKDRRE